MIKQTENVCKNTRSQCIDSKQENMKTTISERETIAVEKIACQKCFNEITLNIKLTLPSHKNGIYGG